MSDSITRDDIKYPTYIHLNLSFICFAITTSIQFIRVTLILSKQHNRLGDLQPQPEGLEPSYMSGIENADAYNNQKYCNI